MAEEVNVSPKCGEEMEQGKDPLWRWRPPMAVAEAQIATLKGSDLSGVGPSQFFLLVFLTAVPPFDLGRPALPPTLGGQASPLNEPTLRPPVGPRAPEEPQAGRRVHVVRPVEGRRSGGVVTSSSRHRPRPAFSWTVAGVRQHRDAGRSRVCRRGVPEGVGDSPPLRHGEDAFGRRLPTAALLPVGPRDSSSTCALLLASLRRQGFDEPERGHADRLGVFSRERIVVCVPSARVGSCIVLHFVDIV
ncbi:hypothetical protein EYF80_022954 [Liparis tanakae]|uniref:Uncharacterized protein n=1 Tax=Liparis tanakae TaxID=230148 RepID=A0A4Z2HNQ1_9TELE|nr:hypothetical protein EYF80_022954 [Liparis tanakae]